MSYTRVAIVLHWVIASLIITVLMLGLIMTQESSTLPTPFKFSLYQWHKSIGITILLLSCFRLYWRLTHKPSPLPDTMSAYERFAARAAHVLFYVLMIGLPIGGWIIVSSSTLGIPTVLYGIVPWPHLPMPADIETRKTIGGMAGQAHQYGAYFLIALLVLHATAALRHHFYDKDDILTRMIPLLKKRSAL